MTSYKAQSISRNDIRYLVREIRRGINMENTLYFPVVKFLENILPLIITDFQLEIVPLDLEAMGNMHGETYPSSKLIRIREDVYLHAIKGNERDRLTIAHEIGHLLLHNDDSIALCRLAPNEKLKPYEDPEWQANAFGGELLAPSYLIKGLSEEEIHELCGVSMSAAVIQLRTLCR